MRALCNIYGLLVISVVASLMLAACPLPYDYNGKGAGSGHATDPSSPKLTNAVTVTYAEQGGATGTIADGGSFASGKTTTVTLACATNNSVIYYTDDGTTITDFNAAKKFDASGGSITITRTAALQTVRLYAVAIGPNMLPSQPVQAMATVSPYPVLTITVNTASVTEDGGTATFTIAASSAPTVDITVNLVTGGTYSTNNETGLTVAPNSPFTATLAAGTTTLPPITVTGVRDPSTANHTVTLTIQPGSGNPPPYTVGTPSSASVVLQDDGKYTVTYNANGGSGTVPAAANYLPGTLVTVPGNGGGLVKPGYSFNGWNTQAGGGGTGYAANQTFNMPSFDVILYAQWTALPVAATPTFSLGGGVYATAQTVTISCVTGGATIRYTTDGTTPSETNGTVCSTGQQLTISSYTVLRAVAYGSGLADSAVATATYTILSSFAGSWTLTNQLGDVSGVFDMVLIAADTYHFINNSGYVWSGIYQLQLQGGTPVLVMITPDNSNYAGFVWNIDSQTHLTLSNQGDGATYAGSTIAR